MSKSDPTATYLSRQGQPSGPDPYEAPAAAGVIHSDFERGFSRAEVIHCEDLVTLGSEAAVRQARKARVEGKEYEMQDGYVMHFRFNV